MLFPHKNFLQLLIFAHTTGYLSVLHDITHIYQNITNEDRATLLHYKATEAAIIHQNHVEALELEEKAIEEACGKGTTRIFNLSSMYLDAGSYCMKLIKPEQALDYIEKSANILV